MIRALRAVPPSIAAAVVLGAALLTIGLLSAVDSITGSGDAEPVAKREPEVVSLDDLKPRKPEALPEGEREKSDRPSRSGTPLARLVGAKLIARMDGTAVTADLLERARAGRIGGVIIFPAPGAGGDAELRDSVDRLQAAAREGGGPGLLIMTDQEGGEVKRYPAGPPSRSPASMGSRGVAEREGRATGSYLAELGINVNLAPVLDVPSSSASFIASRAFGSSADRVGSLGSAFAGGLQSAGVAATAKHFPGLGSATVNTDLQRSVIDASAGQLDVQLAPFRGAVDAGIALVMVSSAVYAAYDGAMPAVLSRAVVRDRLRRDLGFDGIAVTDDLETPAIAAVMPAPRAAVTAASVGIDMLMFAKTAGASVAAYDALLAAGRSGKLGRGRLEDSYDRIENLVSQLGP